MVAIVAGSLLASCALAPKPSSQSVSAQESKEYFSEKEYGVAASPLLVAYGKDVPDGGGRYHVGKPYKIKGKTYRPKEDPHYTKVGQASWYGRAFHGRKTANGEIYDMGELTAAHPTLPLPSYVRVTNMANQRSVVVRVNDRGPFKKGRIIDVSATAAEMLDFKRAGTAKVKVEYVGRGRMDGRDRQQLLASYRGPNDFGGDTLFASNATSKPKNVVLAALTPSRRGSQPRSDRAFNIFGAQTADTPPAVEPAYAPSAFSKDPLGPLILSTGFTNSYAATDRFTRAQVAATDLARGGKTIEIVQIGSYSDKANADRLVEYFSAYGNAVSQPSVNSDRTLYMVRVMVDGSGAAGQTVLAAARAVGIADAFVVAH